ncbi:MULTISPECIES: hypothetical protein [Microbacterium]|uniref:hypothetical protein n=1 Tax=Microbacterium TaxID=33882 RepID=UPI00277F83CC|nr:MULTISPECIES: hypothetical protein [Microbacterium]MDQ1076586.1 hypothetical protein [Microbacterium sp. SORGH_AS_0969]MDQ1116824.1 hypothetical protein [Microbacterium testaceum]
MSYALQPDQVIGIADRLRRALDETLACSDALRDAVDALSTALSGATSAHAAFDDGAEPRVRLSRGMVSHGLAAVAALRRIIAAYVSADDQMAATTSAADGRTAAPLFDPSRFGARPS